MWLRSQHQFTFSGIFSRSDATEWNFWYRLIRFLQETSQNEIPDLDKLEVNLNKRMKYRQSLQDNLRKRFRVPD